MISVWLSKSWSSLVEGVKAVLLQGVSCCVYDRRSTCMATFHTCLTIVLIRLFISFFYRASTFKPLNNFLRMMNTMNILVRSAHLGNAYFFRSDSRLSCFTDNNYISWCQPFKYFGELSSTITKMDK